MQMTTPIFLMHSKNKLKENIVFIGLQELNGVTNQNLK